MKIKIPYRLVMSITALVVSLTSIIRSMHWEKGELENKNPHIEYTYADAFLNYFGREVCVVTEIRTWEKLRKGEWKIMWYTRGAGKSLPPEAFELENVEELLCKYVERTHPELKGKITPESIKELNERKKFEEEARNAEMDKYYVLLQYRAQDLEDGGLSNINLRKPNRKKPPMRKFKDEQNFN